MAPRISGATNTVDEIGNASIPSFSVNGVTEMGFHIEECDAISEREFRMMMALVVIATLTFGCLVHGWLI